MQYSGMLRFGGNWEAGSFLISFWAPKGVRFDCVYPLTFYQRLANRPHISQSLKASKISVKIPKISKILTPIKYASALSPSSFAYECSSLILLCVPHCQSSSWEHKASPTAVKQRSPVLKRFKEKAGDTVAEVMETCLYHLLCLQWLTISTDVCISLKIRHEYRYIWLLSSI